MFLLLGQVVMGLFEVNGSFYGFLVSGEAPHYGKLHTKKENGLLYVDLFLSVFHVSCVLKTSTSL